MGHIVDITLIIRRWLGGFSEGKAVYQWWFMRSVIVAVLVVIALSACPSETSRSTVDAAVELDGGADIDAGPPAPTTLEPTVVAVLDGGVATLIAQGTIDPATALTVTLPMKLKDFRVRVLDWRDQVVASDDELMADGLTYVIAFPDPLKTGRSYTLVLDAELGPVITAETGATFNDWELPFRISGEVVPDAPARKAPTKKKSGKK